MKILQVMRHLAFAAAIAAASAAAAGEIPNLDQTIAPAEGAVLRQPTPSTNDSFVIGLSNFALNNDHSTQTMAEARYEAAQFGEIKQFIITDAGGSVPQQIADIEDLAARGVDAIIVRAGSETALNAVIEKVYDQGIPVIIFSSSASPKRYTTKIVGDDKEFGRVGAEYLARDMGGKGKVIAIRGIAGNSIDTDRWAGAKEVFDTHPEIEVVGEGYGEWAYDRGKQVCESLLLAHPDITGIWSSGGAMTQACAEAMVEYGLDLVPMSGEAGNGFLRVWQEMNLQSVAPQYPTWLGAQAVIASLRILKGAETYDAYVYRTDPITRDEIPQFYRPELKDSYWVGSILPEDQLKSMYGK
ncbi:ABC transporter substrate-binding protein [Ensifer sp. YR511]|uniref:ABC transporter substrate-binding protein n=1 Tax=Ensifer sp. YR511 TaxID=1855294 RepID=UPI00088B72E2|nr:ABC transporter substrate-binding protein [Ensifer sp. YR511]SDN04790.1 ribose transport system substrate-binding protein [Ensifer sp. YR511]